MRLLHLKGKMIDEYIVIDKIERFSIFGIENSKVKRLILEFTLNETEVQELDFIIEKSPRQYSDQYLELTKEFHVFSKT